MDADAIVAEPYTDAARHDPNPWYAKLHELGPVSALDPKTNVYAADETLRDPRFVKVPVTTGSPEGGSSAA